MNTYFPKDEGLSKFGFYIKGNNTIWIKKGRKYLSKTHIFPVIWMQTHTWQCEVLNSNTLFSLSLRPEILRLNSTQLSMNFVLQTYIFHHAQTTVIIIADNCLETFSAPAFVLNDY